MLRVSVQGTLDAQGYDLPRQNYALHIADTVLVGALGKLPVNITKAAASAWKSVAYQMKVRIHSETLLIH